jgi:hypothetical protein
MQIRTIPDALFSKRVICFPARLLTKGDAQRPAAEISAAKKSESRKPDNEQDKTRRTQTTAGHR